MKGACNCGAVTVRVSRRPEYINFCNCSLCRKTGGGWGYFDRDEVEVSGTLEDFVRNDLDEVFLATQFCPGCGSAVRWVPLPRYDTRRVGVNMRLFDPAELAGIECRFPDGMNRLDERPGERHPPLPYGQGTVF
jgi:hypothetical protein